MHGACFIGLYIGKTFHTGWGKCTVWQLNTLSVTNPTQRNKGFWQEGIPSGLWGLF